MRWMKDILDMPGVRPVVNVKHIKALTFSKRLFNPTGTVPIGDGFVLP